MEALVLENNIENQKITVELNTNELQMFMKFKELEQKEEDKRQELEEEKKNVNFIQIYRDNMPELRWLMTKQPFASSLLFFILEHMDTKNALACSYSVFCDYFEKGRTTVYRAIKILEENGFIDVLKMGTSNVYIVNQDLAWTSYHTSKKYAKYDGNILVSKKENKDYQYRSQFERFKTLREREGLK